MKEISLTDEELGCFVLCVDGAASLDEALTNRHRLIFSYPASFIRRVWNKREVVYQERMNQFDPEI